MSGRPYWFSPSDPFDNRRSNMDRTAPSDPFDIRRSIMDRPVSQLRPSTLEKRSYKSVTGYEPAATKWLSPFVPLQYSGGHSTGRYGVSIGHRTDDYEDLRDIYARRKQEMRATFGALLDELLGIEKSGKVKSAFRFNKIFDVNDLLVVEETVVPSLQFPSGRGDDVLVTFSVGHQGRVKVLLRFLRFVCRRTDAECLDMSFWLD